MRFGPAPRLESSLLLTGAGPGAGAGPTVFVDSENGSDSNDGLSAAAPKETLSAAVTLVDSLGTGTRMVLAGDSYWRETLAPTSENLRIEWDGSGSPPVITGYDVQTSWVDDTATVAGRWYKDVSHGGSATNRQTVLRDEVMMSRVASAAACTTDGQYYSADCGTANPIRVYINVGAENPNSSGSVYEVTTRLNAVFLQDGCTITGVVARGAISNNGPLEVGTGCTVSRCVCAFGTKHNFLIEGGTMTDCVAVANDAPTASEPSTTIGVAYKIDASALSVTLRRVFFKSTAVASSGMFAHSNSSPSQDHASITLDQCAFDMFNASPVTAGAQVVAISNTVAFGALPNGGFQPYAHTSFTAERCSLIVKADSQALMNQSNALLTATQVAICKTVTGGAKKVIAVPPGSTATLQNVTVDVQSGINYGVAVGWPSGTTGALVQNDCLIVANNTVAIASSGTFAGDDTTYFSNGIGPYNNYRGTNYDLTSAFAGWRTASGGDAASAVAGVTFSGTTSDGDFQQTGALAGSGVTEHWNYNTRAVVSTPPTRLPVVPQDYAEAVSYIAAPEAWDFYP